MTDTNDTTEAPEQGAAAQTIFELMPKVAAAIGSIGKGQTNDFHGYSFRGIDDVYNAVGPALHRHGVTMVPKVLSRNVTTMTTSRGKEQRLVEVEMLFTFHGPTGDRIEVGPYWGEGMDAEDKGTNKAISSALKYALFGTFLIPTDEQVNADADHGSDPDAGPDAQRVRVMRGLRDAFEGDLAAIAACLHAYEPGAQDVLDLSDEPLGKLDRALSNDDTRARVVAGVRQRMEEAALEDAEPVEDDAYDDAAATA